MKKKAICLLSDGLDSPVATFLLERKKIEVIGLNFSNYPFVNFISRFNKNTNEKSRLQLPTSQIKTIAQALVNAFSNQTEFILFQEPHGEDLKKIIELKTDNKYTCVLCKRLMIKKAEYLAEKLGAELIATGDILGEQASQTIDNLKVIQEAIHSKVLVRPAIGLNKDEIITLAKKIGSYEYSELGAKVTCTAVPTKPSTKAILETVISLEEQLEIHTLVEESYEKASKFEFHKQ